MKRLICCLDGTWNSDRGDEPLTNVVKLHRAVAAKDARETVQKSIYVPGIASGVNETVAFLKGAVGFEVSSRIREAYHQIVADYEAGDELYLFGFSRGAFEARSLGGFITLFGIARKDGAFSFDEAWQIYQQPAGSREAVVVAKLTAAAHHPVRIKCMGVWDTVGNLGNPFSAKGAVGHLDEHHDIRLSDAIEVGLHALSIDEVRGPFRPTLWTLPPGQEPAAHQHIEQVWFAGSHADVGGGYAESELSDIPLHWMARRANELTGLAFDQDRLHAGTNPNALAAQHASATGRIFYWSGLLPCVRVIQQKPDAISPLRRSLLGDWRTSRPADGEIPVNESIHESVVKRRGMRVAEIYGGTGRLITYAPRNLQAALADGRAVDALRERDSARGARVRIYTVHGTFAHAAEWDNWAIGDNDAPPERPLFINRLSDELRSQHRVTLEQADHIQYEWSGGNSHDERRTAAIGLKQFIQKDLEAIEARLHQDPEGSKSARDYYNGGVFVIGHSHGGTISRMAMNLWDSKDEFFDPKGRAAGELKHDDTCPICMRERNGEVKPNTFSRPDGVITFGSPFVHFTERKSGLIAVRLFAWALVLLGLVGVIAFYAWPMAALVLTKFVGVELSMPPAAPGYYSGVGPIDTILLQPVVAAALPALGPLVCFWLLALYIPRSLLRAIERLTGKENVVYLMSRALLRYAATTVGLILLGFYYVTYFRGGGWTEGGGWTAVTARFPFLAAETTYQIFWVLFPLVAYWLLALSLPSRLLALMRRRVDQLRADLPKKYDPREPLTRPTPYLSYTTPGDEAGLGLHFFGGVTWVVQTLTLAASMVLTVGIVSAALMMVELLTTRPKEKSLLGMLGLSPGEASPKFVWLMDWLTFYPVMVLNWLSALTGSGTTFHNLGDLGQRATDAAPWVPWNVIMVVGWILVFVMPVMLAIIGAAYVISMALRGSGLVFGGERFTWTMANNITANRRPGPNTRLKTVVIAPEAWRNGKMAHCYFYESHPVIKDLAARIAHWRDFQSDPALRPGPVVSTVARWGVVMFFVLAIFAQAVHLAERDGANAAARRQREVESARPAATETLQQVPQPPAPAEAPSREPAANPPPTDPMPKQ